MDDRAVLLKREINGSAGLGWVDPFTTQVIVQMDGQVAPGLLLPPSPGDLDAKLAKVDPHLLQNHHHIRPGAGSRRKQQREHWSWAHGIVTIHYDGWPPGLAAGKAEALLPDHCRPLGLSRHCYSPTLRSALGATR